MKMKAITELYLNIYYISHNKIFIITEINAFEFKIIKIRNTRKNQYTAEMSCFLASMFLLRCGYRSLNQSKTSILIYLLLIGCYFFEYQIG